MNLNQLVSTASKIIDNPTIKSNAAITFQKVVSPSTTEKDEAGRLIPIPAEVETVTLECYLKQSSPPFEKESSDSTAGINRDAVFFRGRLTCPKTYQFPIQSNTPIRVTVNGRTGTMIEEQKSMESPTSEQYNIKKALGQRISFYVQFTQGN